jgi:hypothetical protein
MGYEVVIFSGDVNVFLVSERLSLFGTGLWICCALISWRLWLHDIGDPIWH